MMYVIQNIIKAKTVNTLEIHGPPSSARPQLLLRLLIMSSKMVAIASAQNSVTLKPSVPASTFSVWLF